MKGIWYEKGLLIILIKMLVELGEIENVLINLGWLIGWFWLLSGI